MKITDVKVQLIDTGREFQLTFYGGYKIEGGVVRVFTNEGIEGNVDYCSWGQPPKLLGELILAMKPYIIGEDPLNIERIWNRTFKTTRSYISIQAAGCINTALWDIAGKALNLPIYRLLGGFRERVRAYGVTHTLPDIDAYLTLAESLKQRGFTAIKLHPWGEPDRDINLCRAVRRAVGDEIDLMLDPLGLYNRRTALKVGRVLDELNFYWYQEPIPEADVEGYIELCHNLDVPILGVDSLRLSLGNYADYISRGAFDLVRADAGRQGITWTKKLATLAEGFGRNFEAHCFGFPLVQAANLHLMGAISNGEFFEMPVPEGIMDTAMKDTITLDADGYVSMPQKPGLGLDVDWNKMNKLTTAVLE